MSKQPTPEEIRRERERLEDLDYFDPHREQTDPWDRTSEEIAADSGRANLTSAIVLTAIATIGATFVTSWALQAVAMLWGVG